MKLVLDEGNCLQTATEVISTNGGHIKSQYCELIAPQDAVEENTVITMTVFENEVDQDIDVSGLYLQYLAVFS